MFKVNMCCNRQRVNVFKIVDDNYNYLHSDGAIYPCGEYWPTRKQAQAVLDKFQPKHIWKHGDVFRNGNKHNPGTMMYLHPEKDYRGREPQVVYVHKDTYPYAPVEQYTDGATFLFNIKDKL